MSKEQLKAEWRKRNTYHPPLTESHRNAHSNVNDIILEAGLALIDICPESRELSTALTEMTLARMLANASLAVHVNAASDTADTTEEKLSSDTNSMEIEQFASLRGPRGKAGKDGKDGVISNDVKGDENIIVTVTENGITIGLAPALITLLKRLKTDDDDVEDYLTQPTD